MLRFIIVDLFAIAGGATAVAWYWAHRVRKQTQGGLVKFECIGGPLDGKKRKIARSVPYFDHLDVKSGVRSIYVRNDKFFVFDHEWSEV